MLKEIQDVERVFSTKIYTILWFCNYNRRELCAYKVIELNKMVDYAKWKLHFAKYCHQKRIQNACNI